MELAKITRSGLTTIAILVAALWGCLYAEQRTVQKAQFETYRALRIMYKHTRRVMEPASAPVRTAPAHTRQMIG